MNTRKQVNLMVGLLFLVVISMALYWIWDPIRAQEAQEKQTEKAAERGAALFVTFCRTCHGNQGLGRLERNDLPGLPLNLTDNRPTGALDLEQKQALLRDTIRCGRVGTLMPPWARDQGGALNDEQMRQLVVLISTNAGNAWRKALEFANHADATGKRLTRDVAAADTTLSVDNARGLPREISPFIRLDEELVRIVRVRGNDLVVERGQLGTKAQDHASGSPLYEPPIAPPEGPINEQACGQFARGLAARPPAQSVAPDAAGNVSVEMGDNFFVQSRIIDVQRGQEVSANLTNNGKAIHNMRLAGLDGRYDTRDDFVSNPDTVKAGAKATLKFRFDQPGTYNFRCDFHPDEMTGAVAVAAP